MFPTHEQTAVTQMPHLFVTTTSTQSGGALNKTAQLLTIPALKFLGPDGEVIGPQEMSQNQKYNIVFLGTDNCNFSAIQQQ